MTRYAKRKLKYSLNENFNLLPYFEWDRFVTLTGAQAESREENLSFINNYIKLFGIPTSKESAFAPSCIYRCPEPILAILFRRSGFPALLL
jgi:histidinol phosphatase-like PHP family hydrolase